MNGELYYSLQLLFEAIFTLIIYLTKLRAVKTQAETEVHRRVAHFTVLQYQPKPSIADIFVELLK
jgi:hypothetical protein